MANIVMVLFCCFPPAWLNFDFGSQVVQGSFLWENVSFLAVSVDRGSKQYWNALLNDVQVVVSCKSPCHSCKQCKHTFLCCVNRVKHLQPGNMTLLQRDHQSVQIFSLDSHHLNDLHVALNAHSLSFLHSGPWKHSLSELMICAKYLTTQPTMNKQRTGKQPITKDQVMAGSIHPKSEAIQPSWGSRQGLTLKTMNVSPQNRGAFGKQLFDNHWILLGMTRCWNTSKDQQG